MNTLQHHPQGIAKSFRQWYRLHHATNRFSSPRRSYVPNVVLNPRITTSIEAKTNELMTGIDGWQTALLAKHRGEAQLDAARIRWLLMDEAHACARFITIELIAHASPSFQVNLDACLTDGFWRTMLEQLGMAYREAARKLEEHLDARHAELVDALVPPDDPEPHNRPTEDDSPWDAFKK
jgi:hypothetical protein